MSTTPHYLFNGDVMDGLRALPDSSVDTIIMDPPDNLGLKYAGMTDKRPADDYEKWLQEVISRAWVKTKNHLWVSYYHEYDPVVMSLVHRMLKCTVLKDGTWHKYIWRFTFGQYVETDCGSGYRPVLRLSKPGAALDTSGIRVTSERMKIGDSRAAGPRVPDDVWDFPRVTGNKGERRVWHPTQHPEGLYARILRMSGHVPQALGASGDQVEGALEASPQVPCALDCFAGTGTLFRVAKHYPDNSIRCLAFEQSEQYCREIASEHGEKVLWHLGIPEAVIANLVTG